MAEGRPDFSKTVVKTLFALSANVCAFIDLDSDRACEEKLTDPKWKRVKAEIAHIRGWAPLSPRYDASYPDPQCFDNLLLLCRNCHARIDDLEPDRYTVDVLTEMKLRSESRADPARPWADDATLSRLARQLRLQAIEEWATERLRFEQEEDRRRLAQAINDMPEREKIVLTLYYFEGLAPAEIGEVLGVSESRACDIQREGLAHLRSKLAAPEHWEPEI